MEIQTGGKKVNTKVVLTIVLIVCLGICAFFLGYFIYSLKKPSGEGWVQITGTVIRTQANPPKTVIEIMFEGVTKQITISEYNIEFNFNKTIPCYYNSITGELRTNCISKKVFIMIGAVAFGFAGFGILGTAISEKIFLKNYVKPVFSAESAYIPSINTPELMGTQEELNKGNNKYVIKKGTLSTTGKMYDDKNQLVYESYNGKDENGKSSVVFHNLVNDTKYYHTFKAARIAQPTSEFSYSNPSQYYFILDKASCFDYLESVGIRISYKDMLTFEVYYLNKKVGTIKRDKNIQSTQKYTLVKTTKDLEVSCDKEYIDALYLAAIIINYMLAKQMLFH